MTPTHGDPAVPPYGSVAKSSDPYSPASSTSSLSLWRGKKILNGSVPRSEIPSPRSLSPTSSCSQLPPTNIRIPNEDMAALYASPLMGGGGGGYFSSVAPTPTPTPRTLKPSTKVPAEPSAQAAHAPSSSAKEPKLSIKRVRNLISRRSISSFDAMLDTGTGDHEQAASSLETPATDFDRQRQLPPDPFGDRPNLTVFVPDTGSNSPRIYTHFVVGDVWEECDINEAISVLRSLKFAGK